MLFQDNDSEYLEWLHDHQTGYVVNLERRSSKRYAVLHLANCALIKEVAPTGGVMPEPGGFTERDYIKLCAGTVSEARDALKNHLSNDLADFSKRCQKCSPA